MSEEALVWVAGQKPDDPTAKFTLNRLAAFADAEGFVWCPIDRLAFEVGCSSRTAQYKLRGLESAGLIERTDRTHPFGTRNVPVYRLALELPAAQQLTKRNRGRSDTGANSCAHDHEDDAIMGANGCAHDENQDCTHMGATVCAHKEKAIETNDISKEISSDGEEEFETLWRAWIKADPSYSQRAEALSAWAQAINGPVEPWQLRDAGLAYLRLRAQAGSKMPEWLHVWLRRDHASRAHLTPSVPRGQVNAVRPSIAGTEAAPLQSFPSGLQAIPTEFRDQVVLRKGEAWASSWVDSVGFNPETRQIHARSAFARGRLQQELGPMLKASGFELGEPVGLSAGRGA